MAGRNKTSNIKHQTSY